MRACLYASMIVCLHMSLWLYLCISSMELTTWVLFVFVSYLRAESLRHQNGVNKMGFVRFPYLRAESLRHQHGDNTMGLVCFPYLRAASLKHPNGVNKMGFVRFPYQQQICLYTNMSACLYV